MCSRCSSRRRATASVVRYVVMRSRCFVCPEFRDNRFFGDAQNVYIPSAIPSTGEPPTAVRHGVRSGTHLFVSARDVRVRFTYVLFASIRDRRTFDCQPNRRGRRTTSRCDTQQ